MTVQRGSRRVLGAGWLIGLVAAAAIGSGFATQAASAATAPTASLTLTPAKGIAPLSVRADASGSAAADLPIASYRFDFGDASPVVGPQAGATADHTYGAAGTYTVTVTVADSGGQAAVATEQVTVSPAIVGNPSFETGVSGWNTSGSAAGVTLRQVSGGHSGGSAAKLSSEGAATCMLNDAPNWVTTTRAGRYVASLWVRSDTPGATLKLKLREYDKQYGHELGVASSTVALTTDWQQVSIRYGTNGGSTLDYTAYIYDAAPGACFYADDAAIDFQPAASPALSVTPDTGVPPVSVHVDASGSKATESPIASYTFRFGDFSREVGPQKEPTADHTYTDGGRYDVTVTVTDSDGRSSSTSRTILLTPNEIRNPTFEDNWIGSMNGIGSLTAWWNTSGSDAAVTLSKVAGGHGGTSAARLTNTGTAAADCVLNDTPNAVTTTGAGRYLGVLWVRSDPPGATLKLKLREYRTDSGALVGSARSAIALTTAWQRVNVDYAPLAPGESTLDYTALVSGAGAGRTCFDADDAGLYYEPTPAPSLTVTPATGVAPVSVHAQASAAAQPVWATYSFDFGDGSAPVTSHWSGTAEHSYASAGTYTVTVKITYANGESATATRQVTIEPGLVANPSFESGTSGWNSSGSAPTVALAQVAEGYSGTRAARLTNRGATSSRCLLNDAPNWIATTTPGTLYTASLWVRSDVPDQRLKLKLREYRKDNGAFLGEAKSTITLTNSWQQVSVGYTPQAAGASTLDYTAYMDSVPAGTACFDADDAAIERDPVASLTLTPGNAEAPTSVRADASASASPDGTTIDTYRFNFGDGSVLGPQSAATADHTYWRGGTYGVAVTVTDSSGRSTTTTRQVTTAQRVADPSFEGGTEGWEADGSSPGVTLTRVPHGRGSTWAAALVNGATPGATCVLNDAPDWVATTAGGRYAASLYARAADLATANVPLTLKVREYRKDNGSLVGTATSSITLKTTYQRVALDYVPAAPGESALDLTASVANVAPGNTCFYADDASFLFEPPATAP